MSALLEVRSLGKRFGGFTALEGIELKVAPGERVGLIGPNGSGKSTLVNCICGALRNESGAVVFAGEDVTRLAAHQRTRRGMARSFQVPRPFASMSVLENLLVPIEYASKGGDEEAMAILKDIGLAAKAGLPSGGLTQVEMRKLELARAMAAKPKLLISDEAMAGLAPAEVDEVLPILFRLNEAGITIIMIEHIMHAVMRFSQRVVCLDAGRIICEGTPGEVVKNADVQRAYLGA
ncbi:MAG TPA: ABC transporter ATP-binding protein [Burkholderiales bacterium]|jgi:branched-chain amino acid transport system ATP-binding protein|nr:ABC transporter ATP-binding protein [Burkholderiales bacterium]